MTFVLKRLSAVGSKRISQFFDSARVAAFTGHCSCRFHVGFFAVVILYSYIVVVILYSYIVEYAFKVWSEDKLNKKFVEAENVAELVSQLL